MKTTTTLLLLACYIFGFDMTWQRKEKHVGENNNKKEDLG